MKKFWRYKTAVALAVAAVVMLFTTGCFEQKVKFTTAYQAVLLSNGMMYFGQLDGYGTQHPVLNNVYYIVTQTNNETKQTNNILIKRGKELHEPDRMYLTPQAIIFVEPVGANSQVAQKIAEQK